MWLRLWKRWLSWCHWNARWLKIWKFGRQYCSTWDIIWDPDWREAKDCSMNEDSWVVLQWCDPESEWNESCHRDWSRCDIWWLDWRNNNKNWRTAMGSSKLQLPMTLTMENCRMLHWAMYPEHLRTRNASSVVRNGTWLRLNGTWLGWEQWLFR